MTIGILGCAPGCGATHLSIALANYCASKLRLPTAYLELNSTGDISQLAPENHSAATRQKHSDSGGFCIYDTDYCPSVAPGDVPLLLNQGYSYYIMDIGYPPDADLREFLRCDRKLILGSLAPWQAHRYRLLLRDNFTSLTNDGSFVYLVHTGDKRDILAFSKENHLSMRPVPHIANPFQIEKEQFPFLQGLL